MKQEKSDQPNQDNKKVIESSHMIQYHKQVGPHNLSYQTNKRIQYIELQLSELQNNLHYIQRKNSLDQVKESISHSYNIFSETEAIFRQLGTSFLYQKIKKLLNCYSIIYLILMEKLGKSSNFEEKLITSKTNQPRNDFPIQQESNTRKINVILSQKNNPINHLSQVVNYQDTTVTKELKKLKPLGGIHLYNEQYNRHIESNLDRLKRKLNNQTKINQDFLLTKISEKEKFKQQIFKEINTDIYTSPSNDELALLFNLNSNKYGSELQHITFHDQLQEIAAFFKQSQNGAQQFLKKSKEDCISINFNQGFKETMAQYKVQKEDQANGFVRKVKNLFDIIKRKTSERQNQINQKILQLKKLQEQIKKPQTFETYTQTSLNFEDEIILLKKKNEELQTNYKAIQDYYKNESQNGEKMITYLEHKIAFKDHENLVMKKQFEQKKHFIDFLNEKINNGTDSKVLRKISNLYRNHSRKSSNKLKIQLEQLEKDDAYNMIVLKNIAQKKSQNDANRNQVIEKSEIPQEEEISDIGSKRTDQKNVSSFIQDYEKPYRRKRKPNISFFASPEKSTSYNQRKASFNLPIQRNQDFDSQTDKIDYGKILLQKVGVENKNDFVIQDQELIQKQNKNFAKNDNPKTQVRNSLQVSQKKNSKNNDLKKSAFSSSLGNGNFPNSFRHIQRNSKNASLKQSTAQESEQDMLKEEQELMLEINNMHDHHEEQFDQIKDNYQQKVDVNDSQFQMKEYQMESIKKLNYTQHQNRKRKSEIGNKEFQRRITEEMQQNEESIQDQQHRIRQLEKKFLKLKSSESKFSSQTNSIEEEKQNNWNKSTQKIVNNYEDTNKNKLNQNKTQNRQKSLFSKKNSIEPQNQLSNTSNQSQDFERQSEKNQHTNDPINEKTNDLLKEISIKMEGNTENQKQNMINLSFTQLQKFKKSQKSSLISRTIEITIQKYQSELDQTKISEDTQNQLFSSKKTSKIQSKLSNKVSLNSKDHSIKNQDAIPFRNSSKRSSASNISELKSNQIKQSHFTPSALSVHRQSKILRQNLIEKISTLKGSNDKDDFKAKDSFTQIQNVKKQNNQIDISKKITQESNFSQGCTDSKRIQGFESASFDRSKKQDSLNTALMKYDNEKIEDYFQKSAMKTAIRCKNIQQFKARIKKMHQFKCGQSCKHLQRYLQNFNKFKTGSRQMMRIHVQNMSQSIHSNQVMAAQESKQNEHSFPTINTLNSTGFSSKGFSRGQKTVSSFYKK